MTIPLSMPVFGVSPAFVVSRHSSAFSVEDYVASVEAASALGFKAFQPEIYVADALSSWTGGGARRIAEAGRTHGMGVSQFVAHFLLDHFSSAADLASNADSDALKQALEAASFFDRCPVFTVPQAPYHPVPGEDYAETWSRLVAKIHRYSAVVEAAGFTLAIEVLNTSLVANTDGFLRLASALGNTRLGINLDTGHAWAARENIPLLPSKLGRRLVGLHLKDNDGSRNLPLAPGKGTIPWEPFLGALADSGYSGSLDLEIGCPPPDVTSEYTAGLTHLKTQLSRKLSPQS